ncbi:MAG: preprotein translocase subunit SecE [Bacteroidota bacterium]|nr:preprotein translocase subunit SecE [Bacteroidota bacterium]
MANKIKEYILESSEELLKKTSWPSWNDLQSSAIVVSIASLLIAAVVYLMDISFQQILRIFYTLH